MKRFAILLSIALGLVLPATVSAQSYSPPGQQTPVWVSTPTVGLPGNAVTSEIFSTTQGSDPPALAYEPANIDEGSNYTRTSWLSTGAIDRIDAGQAKFRTNCTFAKFGQFDPILGHGKPLYGHHHTFFGNKGINAYSTYASMRAAPASTCAGGPLNATAYWEPTLLFEKSPGIFVPVKPNGVTFYYTLESYVGADKRVRFLNGMNFIGGVNPADPTNSARLAELPVGFDAETNKPGVYDGWQGFQCFKPSDGSNVTPTGPGVFPDLNPYFTRFLVNPDGSDPFHGACEGPNYTIIANLNAPPCWDGKNLSSPNGRQHVRYPLYMIGAGSPDDALCPDHWYWLMNFEVKTEFPAYTFAMRQKMHLSSDEIDPATGLMTTDTTKWQTPGSTFHFDWDGAWDSAIRDTWLVQCTGTRINGVAASDFPDGRTCGNSTIDATRRMFVTESSPDTSMSNSPVAVFLNLGANGTASKLRFGSVIAPMPVSATMTH